MTKKKAAMKGEKGQRKASSPLSPSSPRKRIRKPKDDRSKSSSKKSRKKSGQGNTSSSSFSLTPNAIESIVHGVDILHRKDDSLESPSKETPSKKEEISTDRKPTTELILRLRLDVPASESSATEGETKGNPDQEDHAALFGTLGDGTSSIRAMLFNPDGIWSKRMSPKRVSSSEKERAIGDWIIRVHGYATTEKFWHRKYGIFPIVCLTSISILETCKQNEKKSQEKISSSLGKPLFSNGINGIIAANTAWKAQAGTIGTFLKEKGPFLTNEELAGSSRLVDHTLETSATASDEEATNCVSSLTRDQNFKKVHECLSQHSAMVTLQRSSLSPPPSPIAMTSESANPSSSSTTAANNDSSSSPQSPASPLKSKRPAQHAWELYDVALREFRTSQMDRQKASLGTNAGRESAERAELVVERHNAALELALQEQGPLSIELLEQWHKELLRGLDPEAGIIRTRNVRCGHTIFCPPKRIRKELELYCAGLKSLELRLDMANNALHAVLFAAVAMFGIVDIHPFLDGNGRLSRIVANYALKKLPFPINLFATLTQRNEYVVAIERTRHVLSLNCAYGDVSRDDLIQVLKTTGVFGSLVQLLMDRVARAATALTAIWDEKSGLAAEAAEAKAARRVRERASRGTCMICLDEKPNIATLCCGNAIHLNCCAEWLSGNNKCPICRHEMPSISRRVVRALEEPEDRWEGEDDDNDLLHSIERRRPAVFSREYHNFVDRFWNEIRSSRGRANRTAHHLSHINRFQADESDYEEEYLRSTTTTTSEDDEDVGEPLSAQIPNASNQNSSQATGEDTAVRSSANYESTSDEQDGELGDTTTTFEGNFENSDISDSTTTTMDGSDENNDTTTMDFSDENNDTTTMDFSDASSQEQRQRRAIPMCCSAARCRNRPAVDCVNNLCGRCCILIGNYHCPRHNS